MADLRPHPSPCDTWWYCSLILQKLSIIKAFCNLIWLKNVTWHLGWPPPSHVSFGDPIPSLLSHIISYYCIFYKQVAKKTIWYLDNPYNETQVCKFRTKQFELVNIRTCGRPPFPFSNGEEWSKWCKRMRMSRFDWLMCKGEDCNFE